MISYNTSILSLLDKVLNKVFYFACTLFFLKQSVTDYALIVLFLLFCTYMYEIYSLSIPKAFNIFYYKFSREIYLSIISFTLYIVLSLFSLFFIISYLGRDFFDLKPEYTNSLFIVSILISGLSIAIDDVVDKYSFLELKQNSIYKFNFIRIISILGFLCIYIIFFKNFNIYNFLFIYSILIISFSTLKCVFFLREINLNIFLNLKYIKKIELRGIPKIILSILLVSILILFQFTINRILIINFEGVNAFASFALHHQVNEIFSIFFLAIIQIIVPAIIRSVKSNNKNKFLLFKEKILVLYILFPPLIFGLINFLGPKIIVFLSSDISYNPPLLFFLSLNLYSISLYITFHQYLIITKKETFFIKVLIFGLGLNLILSMFLIQYLSIVGVAISNFISNCLIFIMLNKNIGFFYLRKKTLNLVFLFLVRLVLIFIILIYFPIIDFSLMFLNIIKDFLYYVVLFLLTELILRKKYRAISIYKNFIKILQINVK